MITIGKKRRRRPLEKLLVKLLEMEFIIRQLVSNRFKLNQAIESLHMLKDRKIMKRGVIILDE
jgi:hypothetical protein